MKTVIEISLLIFSFFDYSASTRQHRVSTNGIHLTGSGFISKLKGIFFSFSSSFYYILFFILCTPVFLITTSYIYQKSVFFGVIAIMSAICAKSLYNRIRLIEDTPSTSLSSAAQGYAEIEGKVRLYDDEIVRGPNMDLPVMVWYGKDMQSSTAGFILEDEKGRCTIDPNDAEVITPRYNYSGHSYNAIYPGETIYILGYLETLNKHRTEYERNALIGKKISYWKRNRYRFLDLFDTDKDGKIDDSEMAFARENATRLVDEDLEEVYQAPATHVISRPDDGRPFLLSSIHPDKLLKRYKISLWIHLFIWIYLSILVLAMQAR